MNNFITKTILVFALLLNPHLTMAITVESIAATIESRIITTGDVVAESKIIKVHSSAGVTLPIEGSFSRELLDQMINRELVYREAVRANFESDGDSFIDDMLQFEKKFSKPEEFPLFLKEEGLLLGDIVEWFHKRQVTMAYINEKISLMSYIGALDTEKYYREHPDLFEGRPFEEVESEIRARLLQKKGEVFLEEWIKDLRQRGKVQYFIIPQDQSLY